MSIKLPITTRKIQNHFQYHFWKYLLLIALAFFGWNLIYTTTRYRPPESAKIEFIAEGYSVSDDALQALADQIHATVMPEMEEVTATIVTFDDMYGDMQLVVWVSAAQGDVYLVNRERFLSMAASDGTLDLTPYVQSGALDVSGLDLSGGWVTAAGSTTSKLMGIPADALTGLQPYGIATENNVLCLLANGGNDAYAVKFLNYLLTHMQAGSPEMPAA